jgi:hypothetical protein
MFNAALKIKELTSKLDFETEAIPENNLGMLSRLITSLKGAPLKKEEEKILKEIIECDVV